MKTNKVTPNNVLLTREQVEYKTTLSRSSIYKYMNAKCFPRPIKIGLRKVRWINNEIDDWMKSRKKAEYSGDDQTAAAGAESVEKPE